MHLCETDSAKILSVATSYLGHPYSLEFDCIKFVRTVYKEIGIIIPKLYSYAPPREFNIIREQLLSPPIGHLMFLKDPKDPRKHRDWTHVVIIGVENTCIHCSIFFGEKVVITPLAEIFKTYDFAESITT